MQFQELEEEQYKPQGDLKTKISVQKELVIPLDNEELLLE